jgi:transcriptional regulator with XRE-family HTH domain
MPNDDHPKREWGELGLRAIDVHVGARIRARRTKLGMSRERLADALELTSSQVQSYEIGMYRVDSVRLFDFARVLKVPLGFFFSDTVKGGDADPSIVAQHSATDTPDAADSDLTSHLAGALCFAGDTRVASRTGDCRVEDLLVGDQLVTTGGGVSFTTVERIWRRPTGALGRRVAAEVVPVRIRRGAFPGNVPQRDLLASRSDYVYLHGEMMPVTRLASPATFVPESLAIIADYVFVLISPALPVFAEGLPIGRLHHAASNLSRAGEYVVY